MIDWEARIDLLMDLLSREHAISDRQCVEILLSALVHVPRTASCWLILETNWFSRDCQDAWFSFGEIWTPISLARIRARSPWREIEAETIEWLNAPSDERLFVECDYDRYPRFHRLTQAQYLLQRSLRVRTRSARAADPLRSLDQRAEDRRADELQAAASYVLEDRAQARPGDPPRFIEPPDFLHSVELVQRLSPYYPDWRQLVQSFALVGLRRAYLFGREETNAEDYRIMARAARDSIPPWIAKTIALLLEGPSTTQTIEKAMALEEKRIRSSHGCHLEMLRLRRNGLVKWNPAKMHWTVAAEHAEGLATVIGGSAFGTERSANAAD
jgi:hypothetical protein